MDQQIEKLIDHLIDIAKEYDQERLYLINKYLPSTPIPMVGDCEIVHELKNLKKILTKREKDAKIQE